MEDDGLELKEWVGNRFQGEGKKRKIMEMLEASELHKVEDVRGFREGVQRSIANGKIGMEVFDAMISCGFFLSPEEQKMKQGSTELMTRIESAVKGVDFGAVQVYSGLPWPSLLPASPRIRRDEEGKVWLVGRECFTNICSQFLGSKTVMDLDGTVGAGKTYLLLMLVLHCMSHFSSEKLEQGAKRKRLVCLFKMPRSSTTLLEDLREALVLCFHDDSTAQNRILSVADHPELLKLVKELNKRNLLHFVLDEYSILDDRSSNVELMNVWNALTALERGCPALHGGTASQHNSMSRLFRSSGNEECCSQFTPFTSEEIAKYLTHLNIEEPAKLRDYTGYLPLLVALYTAEYHKAGKDDARAVEAFVELPEVGVQQRALCRWVTRAANLIPEKRSAAVIRFAKLMVGRASFDDVDGEEDVDLRWVVRSSIRGRYALVSQFAALTVGKLLESRLSDTDSALMVRHIAEHLLDEASVAKPNEGLLGLLGERIVIHVTKTQPYHFQAPRHAAVHYFDDKLGPIVSHDQTMYIPVDWRNPYVDYVVRYMVRDRLHIRLFQVSVGLRPGDVHWKTALKCFAPESMGKYTSGYALDMIDWTYEWVGRECDKPSWAPQRNANENQVHFVEKYHTFSQVFDPAHTDPTLATALKALSDLKRS